METHFSWKATFHEQRYDSHTLNVKINCLCNLGFDYTMSVVSMFNKFGIEIDIVTVNTLLNEFVMNDKLKQGLKFVDQVEGISFHLNNISFGIIIHCICMLENVIT